MSRLANTLIHAFAALAFLSLPLLFMSGGQVGMAGHGSFASIVSSLGYWTFCLTYICIFYLNTYVLIPRFFFTRQYIIYAAIILVLFAVVLWSKPFEHLLHSQQRGIRPPGRRGPMPDGPFMNGRPPRARPDDGPRSMRIDIVSIILYIMTIALGMAIQVTRQWRVTAQQVIKAEAERIHAELSFLKAQINPHFLFNTLNNLYTLAITKSEKTADSIMKLSNIMRYVTDDVSHDLVPLQQEVNCITDFIELQRLRMNKKTQVDLTVEGPLDNKSIPPLVLMTFVENLFKYGISNHEATTNTITITATDKYIQFLCRNKIFNPSHEADRTGIGITNTKKRLEHLYPNKHLLNITNENGFYTVDLMIQA